MGRLRRHDNLETEEYLENRTGKAQVRLYTARRGGWATGFKIVETLCDFDLREEMWRYVGQNPRMSET